jgi:hypothetical protein
VKGSIRQDLEHGLSRRELISGLVGLGMSTVAGKVVAQPSMSPVMRPTPGETLVYDDFSAGIWPETRQIDRQHVLGRAGTPPAQNRASPIWARSVMSVPTAIRRIRPELSDWNSVTTSLR